MHRGKWRSHRRPHGSGCRGDRKPRGAREGERCTRETLDALARVAVAGGVEGHRVDVDGEDLARHVLCRQLLPRGAELGVHMIEPIGKDAEELPEHLYGELVFFSQNLEEVGAANGDKFGPPLFGGDGGGARHAANKGHLAYVLADAQAREDGVATRNPDGACEYDKELVPSLALLDDDLAGGVNAHLDGLHDAQKLTLGQAAEERHLRQHVALQGESSGTRLVESPLLAEFD